MARKEISEVRVARAAKQVEMAKAHGDTQLGTDAILLLTGWSTPTLYRRCKAGEFPRTVAPGRWHGGTVLAHLAKTAGGAAAQG